MPHVVQLRGAPAVQASTWRFEPGQSPLQPIHCRLRSRVPLPQDVEQLPHCPHEVQALKEPALQGCVSLSLPSQVPWQPLHVRVRVLTPSPQLVLHAERPDHVDHCLGAPATQLRASMALPQQPWHSPSHTRVRLRRPEPHSTSQAALDHDSGCHSVHCFFGGGSHGRRSTVGSSLGAVHSPSQSALPVQLRERLSVPLLSLQPASHSHGVQLPQRPLLVQSELVVGAQTISSASKSASSQQWLP